MTFTLDTTGVVLAVHPPGAHPSPPWRAWSDLSPFAQGYVEALFASGGDVDYLRCNIFRRPGFSDLSPEALAMILGDCEAAESILIAMFDLGARLTADDGRRLWQHRAEGFPGPLDSDVRLRALLPPLTVYLGEDGKVWLKVSNLSPASRSPRQSVEGEG